MTHGVAFWFHCIVAVVRRPHLWFPAIRQFLRAVPPRWWTRPPRVPWPDRAYLQFRFETAFGAGASAAPNADDLVRYLEWCREADATRAGRGRGGNRRDGRRGAGTLSTQRR